MVTLFIICHHHRHQSQGDCWPPLSCDSPKHTYNFIGNGDTNSIQHETTYCTILNGNNNFISTGSTNSLIGLGFENTISLSASQSTILNGTRNSIGGDVSTIINGTNNTINSHLAIIFNGTGNTLTSDASNSAIIGLYNFTGTSANTLYAYNISATSITVTSTALNVNNLGSVSGLTNWNLEYSMTELIATGNTTLDLSNVLVTPNVSTSFILYFYQDATGSRTLSLTAGKFRGTVDINTAANSLTIITGVYSVNDGRMSIVCNKDTAIN